MRTLESFLFKKCLPERKCQLHLNAFPIFDGFQILMDIPVLIIFHSDAGEINETDFPDTSKKGVFGAPLKEAFSEAPWED